MPKAKKPAKKATRKAREFYIGLYRGRLHCSSASESDAKWLLGRCAVGDGEVICVREVLPRKRRSKR